MATRAWTIALVAIVAFVVCPMSARSEPKSGFGLFGGIAHHSEGLKQDSYNYGVYSGVATGFDSVGPSVGIDYQFALNRLFSISPFLEYSDESTRGHLINPSTVQIVIYGVDFRAWPGEIFTGLHVGQVRESPRYAGANNPIGGGLSLGWESSTGAVFVVGQLDIATITLAGPSKDVDFLSTRIQLGYRWK